MEGFNYEIKFENSPFEIGNNLNTLKVKSMELPPTSKVADFNISFEDNSTQKMLWEWLNKVSIDNDNIIDEVNAKVLTKRYPHKSKKKRLVKKWWDKHSEIRVYKNVKLNFGE